MAAAIPHRSSSTSLRCSIPARCASSIISRIAATAARSEAGSRTATKDLVFYTDGDAQYDPAEMALLWDKLAPDVDWVNGYKMSRSDPFHRVVIGRLYHHTVKLLFGFKLRDVDCDFRLIRRRVFEVVRLEKSSGVICLEMVKKFHDAKLRVAEVPVHHYHRAYGKSQFFNFRRVFKTAIDVFRLWWSLVVRKEHLKARGETVVA